MADSKAQGNPYCALTEFGTLRCTTGVSIHVVSPLTALCSCPVHHHARVHGEGEAEIPIQPTIMARSHHVLNPAFTSNCPECVEHIASADCQGSPDTDWYPLIRYLFVVLSSYKRCGLDRTRLYTDGASWQI